VSGVERRLAEAARLGFSLALVPASQTATVSGIKTLPVATLIEALSQVANLHNRVGDPRRPVLRTIPGGR
jgi:DNA repair protein RadA/Sms